MKILDWPLGKCNVKKLLPLIKWIFCCQQHEIGEHCEEDYRLSSKALKGPSSSVTMEITRLSVFIAAFTLAESPSNGTNPIVNHRARLNQRLLDDWETNKATGPFRAGQQLAPLMVGVSFGLYSINALVS